MRSSFVLIAALASSALAVPVHDWAEWNTTAKPSSNPTGPTRHQTTVPPTSIITGENYNTTTLPTSKPSILTGVTWNTTSEHPHHSSKPAPTTVLTTYTTTDYITTTKFIPCSTPIGTQSGKTYYSTFLTTEVWTTTSCYPVTSVAPVQATSAPPVTTPAGCPAPSTVTVTAYPNGAAGGYYPPGQCSTCQVVTYTDVRGHVITIAVPKNPWSSPTQASTSTTSTSTSTTTTPHGTGKWSSKPVPTGTGNVIGTGKWTPKGPHAYPTGS